MAEAVESPRWSRTALITAIVLAVLAVIIVNVYWRGRENKQKAGYILVAEATRRLEKDQKIKQEDVKLVSVPPAAASVAGKWIKEDQLSNVLERPLLQPVEKGERLLWSHFTPLKGDPATDLIRPGYRGLTVPVDRKMAPGRLLRPGIYVDILATMPPNPARNDPAMSVTLLERVLVTAVGGRTQHDAPGSRYRDYTTVTIEVTPQEAEKLTTVNSYLRDGFTLTLRNSKDPATERRDRLDDALKRLGLSGGRRGT